MASARSVRRAPCERHYDRGHLGGSSAARSVTAFPDRLTLSVAALNGRVFGERVALAAMGAWTAATAAELERIVEEATLRYQDARYVDIDLARLERLDTFGAWLIERLERGFTDRGSTARIIGLSDADRGLIEEVRLV